MALGRRKDIISNEKQHHLILLYNGKTSLETTELLKKDRWLKKNIETFVRFEQEKSDFKNVTKKKIVKIQISQKVSWV